MRSPSERAQVFLSLMMSLIDDAVDERNTILRVKDDGPKTRDLLSTKERILIGRAYRYAADDAVADGEKTPRKASIRVLEYYIDCGTRPNGWDIGDDGPTRADWERFKRESPFYQRYNKETPAQDTSQFQLPPFSANKDLFAAIASE